MSLLHWRSLRRIHGHHVETSEAAVAAALADPVQRALIEKRTKETMANIRAIASRDPREAAYHLLHTDEPTDALIAYYHALNLLHWVGPLYDILKEHPLVRDVERLRLAVRASDGQMFTQVSAGEGGSDVLRGDR